MTRRVTGALSFVAAALPAQQAPNLLPAPATWSVTANASEVTVSATGTRLDFLSSCNHTNSPVTVDVQFTVPQAGAYLLWLDAEWAAAPGSYQMWTWSLPGVGTGTWKQNDLVNTRNVAQWGVQLTSGMQTLTLSATSHGCGGLGRIWGAELRKVDGPVFVPGLCYVDPFQPGPTGYATFTIQHLQPLFNPVYMLFTSNSVAAAQIVWPFGDQWLANPLYLGALGSPSFTPPSGTAAAALHGLVFHAVGSPQWWQVVEYDAGNPVTTLRIGSPTRTSSLH